MLFQNSKINSRLLEKHIDKTKMKSSLSVFIVRVIRMTITWMLSMYCDNDCEE